MQSAIHTVEIIFLLLLLFVVVFGVLARKLNTPYPIVLVIGGLVLSFVPGIPRVTLKPDVIFFIVLPALLFHAAWLTSWREFSYHFVSIVFLAFGLVTCTVLAVMQAAQWLLPGFDWRVGLVLGAVVAPTDAIAATAIAKKLGLPKALVDILEGESLLNDASALLALEFGIALLVGGTLPTFTSASLRLLYLIGMGIGIGLAIGEIVHQIEHWVDDAPIEIALSILTPYAAYLGAEAVRASGVLAVVACGLYLSRKSSHFFSPTSRLRVWAVWDSLAFILNGLVFVLIGLQLHYVLGAILGEYSLGKLIVYGLAFSLFLIVLRLLWMFPGAHWTNLIRTRIFHQQVPMPGVRQIFVAGWTGMRGVISLAAAIALPQTLANGHPFVQRNMIIFLTFSVILVTLVLQGLTLPPLIRALGLAGDAQTSAEETEARRAVLQAALAHIEQARVRESEDAAEVYDDLEHRYRHRLATVSEPQDADNVSPDSHKRFTQVSRELLQVERKTVLRLRDQRRISDELLRELERELDLAEAQLTSPSAGDQA